MPVRQSSRSNPLFQSARAATARAALPPSPWYWDVIKTRVGQSWNPSSVAGTPAGATADIAFTISRDGSPRDVQLRRPSGNPSLDSSCVLAVQQVKTFGPPEGGTKESLNVLYPCSYNQLESMNAHRTQWNTSQKNAAVMPPRPEPAGGRGSQLGGYIEAAKIRSYRNGTRRKLPGVPGGRNGLHSTFHTAAWQSCSPNYGNIHGYSSLDASCLRAVTQIQTFGHLPRDYNGDSLTVLFHCTYPGSPTTKFTQDSSLPPVKQPPPSGPVDGVQPPTKDSVVTN